MEPADSPRALQELLADYVLGNLTPEDCSKVEELLETMPDVAIELERLQSTLSVLPLSLPHATPSQQLEQRIMQAVQGETQAFQRRPSPQRFSWKWLAAGSAAALLMGLGYEVYRLRQNWTLAQLENQALQEQLAATQTALEQLRQNELVTTRQELSRYQEAIDLLRQPNSRYMPLRGTEPGINSTGSLIIVVTMNSAILTLQDVPVLPEGQVYRMWALVEGEKVACGDFRPDESGRVFVQLPVDQWGETPEIAITVEPTQELAEPIGEMVIFGS
ncbi:anti-sigma factor [Oscillatoria sp. CS-180]|uniref:anti-sigma factor domain-containing protein n=1 Tax=Oscillatoria sp. CS-180 TaxID=3021720 RepID=UPI00232BB53E|nr:anti-sigma factor [Oscillatoria sp. CS-180]MDB9526477.1 anti-sigma factor [Oscillatoria sp. CS-180]